jgi:TIR domain
VTRYLCYLYDVYPSSAEETIFFSYPSEHRGDAELLVQSLTRTGLRIWVDFAPGAIRAGEVWMAALERALDQSGVYVILVAANSISRWVRAEVDYALNRQAIHPRYRIIPLLMPDVAIQDLPPLLRRFQVIKLPPDWDHAPSGFFEDVAEKIRTNRDTPFGATENPFPGLGPFDEKNSRYFFGRNAETASVIRALQDHRWISIEGSSGSGKSSLVRAGVIPALDRQWIRGPISTWITTLLRLSPPPVIPSELKMSSGHIFFRKPPRIRCSTSCEIIHSAQEQHFLSLSINLKN